jgi:hypothetical protein
VHLCERPVAFTLFHRGYFNVVALPFTASSHGYDPSRFLESEPMRGDNPLICDAPTFVISHLAVPGVQPGEETKELPRGREVLYPFAAVTQLKAALKGGVVALQGHYHRRQDFLAPQGYAIHIPGAMARLTMGEERHEPSYLVVDA